MPMMQEELLDYIKQNKDQDKLKDIGDELVDKYNFKISMDIFIIDENNDTHMEFWYCVYNNILVETDDGFIPLAVIILDDYVYVCESTFEKESIPTLVLTSNYVSAYIEDYSIGTVYFDNEELAKDTSVVIKIIFECIDVYLDTYIVIPDEESFVTKSATSIYREKIKNRRFL